MKRKNHVIQEILGSASNASEFILPEGKGVLERYRNFLLKFIDSHEKGNPTKLRKWLQVLEVILLAIGAALGFFIISSETEQILNYIIWGAYIFTVVIVSVTLRLIPDTQETLYLHAQHIRLTNLAERLAAEVALFDLMESPRANDDDNDFINNVSKYIPSQSDIDSNYQSLIKYVLNNSTVFESSRDTNITFTTLNLTENQEEALFDITKTIVDLCDYLFAGKNFTAKLYLKGICKFEENSVEILTSFAKYPADTSKSKGRYGSSWIKARGNPSQVWKCLESGKVLHKQLNDLGSYYNSMLLICLPGRVGVLAITSKSEDAFKDKYDKWLIKSLAIATKALTAEALK